MSDKNDKEDLYIVTEVGTFADLNIIDPTKKKIKKKNNMEDVIIEAHQENIKNLCNKKIE